LADLADIKVFVQHKVNHLVYILGESIKADLPRDPDFIAITLQCILVVLRKLEAVGEHDSSVDVLINHFDEVIGALSNLEAESFETVRQLASDLDSQFIT